MPAAAFRGHALSRIKFLTKLSTSDCQQTDRLLFDFILIAESMPLLEYPNAPIPRALLAFPPCRNGKMDRTTVSRADGSH
jgi:hypothetical protein